MAGGAGMHRGHNGGNGPPQHPNNSQYQGAPQQGFHPQGPPQDFQGGPPQGQFQKPRSGGFDGPGEQSRGPQNPNRPQGPNPGQQAPTGPPTSTNPFPRGLGYDPAKPSNSRENRIISNTRVELPSAAYLLDRQIRERGLPTRPGLNTTGKAIQVRVNQYKVSQWPQGDIFQYDVIIGDGAEKKGKVAAVWRSKAVQEKIAQLSPGRSLIFNKDKICWSSVKFPETRILVNLDAERGRQPRADKPADTCYVIFRPSKQIRMAVIKAYLDRQMEFDDSIFEAINFLDHLMREMPSQSYTQIKRSYFDSGNTQTQIDTVVIAMKGVYSSMRMCNPKSSVGQPSTGLAVNVDVANGTFWSSQPLHQAARNYCKQRNPQQQYPVFVNLMKPVPYGDSHTQSEDFKLLRKFHKLKFRVCHRGKNDDGKIYSIKSFTHGREEMYRDGKHAKNTYFKWRRPNGKEEDITIYQYFTEVYHTRLIYWQLPLVITDKAGMFPMEVCMLIPHQRYNYKLDPGQTQNMIKFAVTRPKQRIESINHGIGMLKWNEDPYLNHFGLKIEKDMTLTAARLLPNPEIQFAGKKLNPGTQGRWDLRGQKFFLSNVEPLKAWAFVIIQGATNEASVRNFVNVFVQAYTGHGGRIENRNPVIYNQSRGEDIPTAIANARQAAGNQVNAYPQILFYVLPGRDSFMYERIKKNSECRFALVSQCLAKNHVDKAQPQYCSNVAMKVNAKLGGTTSKVASAKSFFSVPTMIIGADVSHPTPGSEQASMAAMTMSFDQHGARYAAAVQTNGHRVEMISPPNIRTMFIPQFEKWRLRVGSGQSPRHIYYFRDGVSEGQYAQVLENEVGEMKTAINEKFGPGHAEQIKFTVTVCAKRHHIRFFPKDNDGSAGDRNQNPLPGVLVEQDVTHPFEYDFYLNAHSAIQGTARPVHYHVLRDEAKVPVADFQKMIYQFSYQYMRSTTPVSLFPAVYYAHLASNRARAHEDAELSKTGPRGGQKFEEARQDKLIRKAAGLTVDGSSQTGSTKRPSEYAPLVPLGVEGTDPAILERIRYTMWYI